MTGYKQINDYLLPQDALNDENVFYEKVYLPIFSNLSNSRLSIYHIYLINEIFRFWQIQGDEGNERLKRFVNGYWTASFLNNMSLYSFNDLHPLF